MNQKSKLGFAAVSAFVISNMIGAGVFTSLGFQLDAIPNHIAVLLLWIVGGLLALCGALVYGELGAAMPRSGGEYHYLSEIYHPSVGFLSGWISLTVGFTAPIALAAMAMGSYLNKLFPAVEPMWIALVFLTLTSIAHSFTITMGGRIQTAFTLFNIVLIIVFTAAGFSHASESQPVLLSLKSLTWADILQPGFAISLIYVSYAYSGWNAAAYIAGDINDPKRVLPRSLFTSTILVTLLYFILNLIFLLTAPASDLRGQVEVGFISAQHIFGLSGGKIMSMLISLMLLSSVSSMVFVGPRVSQTMGEDIRMLGFLSKKNKAGIPIYALWFQYLICFVLILTSSFEKVLTYAGFTLSLFTFLTVLGVFVHRYRYPDAQRPYKTWGYPVVPVLFLALVLWTLVYLIRDRRAESLMGFFTVLSGMVIFLLNHIFVKKGFFKKYD